MKKHHATLLAALLAASVPAFTYAGAGHDHGHNHGPGGHDHGPAPAPKLDDKGILAAATKAVSALIDQKIQIEGAPLAAEWKNIPEADKKIGKTGKGYRIVAFADTKAGKTLHLLVSDTGALYDANYTGVFKGLKD